jgi:hypothetical protein
MIMYINVCVYVCIMYVCMHACMYVYTHTIHTVHIYSTGLYVQLLQAHTTYNEGVSLPTHRNYIVLNGNSVLDLHNIFRNITQA